MDTGPDKRIVVTMTGRKPIFSFVGMWTGHDIKAVRNLLWRSYLWYSRDYRRKAIINTETQPKEQEAIV